MTTTENEWVVVAIRDLPNSVPAVFGPYETQKRALAARSRVRNRLARNANNDMSIITTYVREIRKV